MKIFGIENNEVPLVRFNLTIDGGQLLESMDKLGLANLTASLLNKGTQNKTTQELEEAIQDLGASLFSYAGKESITISGTTLAKNYKATLALAQEMILSPRFDESDFELLKKATISSLRQQQANPNAVARNAYNELIYGKENIRAKNTLGTIPSVSKITIEDVICIWCDNPCNLHYIFKNLTPSLNLNSLLENKSHYSV